MIKPAEKAQQRPAASRSISAVVHTGKAKRAFPFVYHGHTMSFRVDEVIAADGKLRDAIDACGPLVDWTE